MAGVPFKAVVGKTLGAQESFRPRGAPCAHTATEVLTEATTLGIAEITLRRARKALGVQVRREGFGKDGRFLLALPSNGTDPAGGARVPKGVGNGNGFDHEQGELVVPSGFPVS